MYSVIQAGIVHQVADDGDVRGVTVLPQSLIILLYINPQDGGEWSMDLSIVRSMVRGQNQHSCWPGNDSAAQRLGLERRPTHRSKRRSGRFQISKTPRS